MIGYWILFGVIAGVLAFMLDPESAKGGLLGSMLIGVVGAIVGGNMATIIFEGGLGYAVYNGLAVVLGSIALLFIRRSIYQQNL